MSEGRSASGGQDLLKETPILTLMSPLGTPQIMEDVP